MKIDIPFIPKLEGYVIYNPATGLFSSGSQYVSWKKKGKIWANIGHLKNHLRMFFYRDYSYKDKGGKLIIRKVYKNCLIVDIATGQVVDFTPNEFLYSVALKEKEYYKNYEIVEE